MPRKLTVAVTVIAFIGLAGALVLLNKPNVKIPVAQTSAKQPPPIIQVDTVPSLAIDSPQPAGETITIAKVALPLHGFVVIRDTSSNKIVGASSVLLFPETMDMKIAATVIKGHNYVAEIHADGDNNGLFDPKLDPPFIVSGKTVTATFKVK